MVGGVVVLLESGTSPELRIESMVPNGHKTTWPFRPITSSRDFLYMEAVKLPRIEEHVSSRTLIRRVVAEDRWITNASSSKGMVGLSLVFSSCLAGPCAESIDGCCGVQLGSSSGSLDIQLKISSRLRSRNIRLVR